MSQQKMDQNNYQGLEDKPKENRGFLQKIGFCLMAVIIIVLVAIIIFYAFKESKAASCESPSFDCNILVGHNVTRMEYDFDYSNNEVTTSYGYNLFYPNGSMTVYLNGDFAFDGSYYIERDDSDASKCYANLIQNVTSNEVWVCVTYYASQSNNVISSINGCWSYGPNCVDTCIRQDGGLNMTHVLTYFVNEPIDN